MELEPPPAKKLRGGEGGGGVEKGVENGNNHSLETNGDTVKEEEGKEAVAASAVAAVKEAGAAVVKPIPRIPSSAHVAKSESKTSVKGEKIAYGRN